MPGEGAMGGFWSVLILLGLFLLALYIFFEVLGYTPSPGPAAGATAK